MFGAKLVASLLVDLASSTAQEMDAKAARQKDYAAIWQIVTMTLVHRLLLQEIEILDFLVRLLN